MSFDKQNYQKAQQALEKIKYLISGYIANNIIAPLDEIAIAFCCRDEVEYSHDVFHKTVAEYIQIVSEKTALYGCKLTLEAAHCEAIFLINHFYRGRHAEGMDGALNDALNPVYKSMAMVISNLNKALKDYAHNKHIQAVKYRYIDSVGWQMRYMMTKSLLATGDVHLKSPMDTWSTEQLSGCLLDLIQNSMKTS